jgi:hypothetical protein
MKRLSRRRFLETAAAAGAASVWGLRLPIAAADPTGARALASLAENVLHGLADHVDALDGVAALLDGDFRVVRTSRSHQLLLNYDPVDVYGKSCETYWSREMHRLIDSIGGLHSFRSLGVYCLDFTVVRYGSRRPGASVGRTVAIGNPYAPVAYLTTSRPAERQDIASAATMLCLEPA